jgi:YVTN family beta-propeller protein
VPKEPEVDVWGNYPPEIGKILVTKCAEGCHDAAHYKDNNGLLMDTWDHLFDGANNGAVVVPYSPEYSSMMYFINTDSSRGIVLHPTMPYNLNPPYNRPPLSEEEYNTIRNWITNGAPDKFGNIPFANNASTRQKVYTTMQGCGLVGVIDVERDVIMRYIKVRGATDDYSPHALRVSPDGQYAYVCFASNGKNIVKINTTSDQVENRMPIGNGQTKWNAFYVTDAGDKVAVTNLESGTNGVIYVYDLNTSELLFERSNLHFPHGIVSNKQGDVFYVTGQAGNVVYKIFNEGDDTTMISLDGLPPAFPSLEAPGYPKPHEIAMTPDQAKLITTCEGSNEVKFIDVQTEQVVRTISVGTKPKEMAFSTSKPYVYITCEEAEGYVNPTFKGSVWIINYNTMNVVGHMEGKFSQPHGIAIDDRNGKIYVASRNANPNGPAPHHISDCGGGRNGFFQAYDINTLQPVSVRHETTPDPYGSDIRFKK